MLAGLVFLVAALGVAWFSTDPFHSVPHAPVLRDEPVYQNSREGLRFTVPEGWIQYARADVPSGKADKERLLVGYRQPVAREQESLLEATLLDLPDGANPGEYLAGSSYGVARWQMLGKPESLTINGAAASRFIFAAPRDRAKLQKEVVVFQRGSRYYFFVGLFSATDETARQAVRRAVGSVSWR